MRCRKRLSLIAAALLALFAVAPSPSAACTGWCDYSLGCGGQCRWEGAGVTQMGCYNSGCACIEYQEICGYSVAVSGSEEGDSFVALLNAATSGNGATPLECRIER